MTGFCCVPKCSFRFELQFAVPNKLLADTTLSVCMAARNVSEEEMAAPGHACQSRDYRGHWAGFI
jgi:hypothetical protein